MTRYILHIGPEKTGTTVIQKALADNARRLRELGILYPKIWRQWLWGHHQLSERLRNIQSDTSALRARFSRLRQTGMTILLSSESFANLKPQHIELLADSIANDGVTLYYYLRRWDKLIPSVWRERVKYGSRKTLPRFYADMMSYPLQHPTLNYRVVADRYAEFFGAENIKFVVYDNLVENSEDIVQHFFRIVLGDMSFAASSQRINEGLDPFEVEIIRVLNQLEYGHDNIFNIEMRERYVTHRSRCEGEVQQLTDIMREHVLSMPVAGNNNGFRTMEKSFLGTYGGNILNKAAPGQIFLETSRSNVDYVETSYLIDPRAAELIRRIYKAVKK